MEIPSEEPPHDRPPDAVIERLFDPPSGRCRAVLQYFHRHSTETATVEDLGAFVRERDGGDQQWVASHLHHVTLPKLAATGLLDYDPRTNTARYYRDR